MIRLQNSMITALVESQKTETMSNLNRFWGAVDPGNPGGISVFNSMGSKVCSKNLPFKDTQQYRLLLEHIEKEYKLEFILLEDYKPFIGMKRKNSYKVSIQIQVCKEVFPDHILIFHTQWNRNKCKDKFKRQWARDLFGEQLPNSHQTDSALMGKLTFEIIDFDTNGAGFIAMKQMAFEQLPYPTVNQLKPWLEN